MDRQEIGMRDVRQAGRRKFANEKCRREPRGEKYTTHKIGNNRSGIPLLA